MRPSIIRRALIATATLTLLTISIVGAETVDPDNDLLTAGFQTSFDGGTVQPSAVVPFQVYFVLTCSGTSHVDATQAVKLTLTTKVVPLDGGFTMASSFIFGLGPNWPADGEPCPAGLTTVGGPFAFSVKAPSTPGNGYTYRFGWTRGLTTGGNDDSNTYSGTAPSITVTLNVAGSTPPPNTPPTLHLPADMTLEGNTTGGRFVTYSAFATDAEDATAPAVTCSPASGAKFLVGPPTTVSCQTTDSGGLTTTGSFQITVQDTTKPTLVGMPGDVTLTTSDPGGTTLTYTKPTASDIVDDSPTVSCDVASGDPVPVGDTPVTCTAKDQSGNTASDSFTVHVRLAQATWEDPAAGGLVINGSRTVPIKVGLSLDGTPITSGDVRVWVLPCEGGSPVQMDVLDFQSNGRWIGHLSTDGLAAGCYRVVATADGVAIGSFRMDVRGDTAPAANPKSTKK
jgi:hypothetical protein